MPVSLACRLSLPLRKSVAAPFTIAFTLTTTVLFTNKWLRHRTARGQSSHDTITQSNLPPDRIKGLLMPRSNHPYGTAMTTTTTTQHRTPPADGQRNNWTRLSDDDYSCQQLQGDEYRPTRTFFSRLWPRPSPFLYRAVWGLT